MADLGRRDLTVNVAKTKAPISVARYRAAIRAFVFAYEKCRFSHDTVQ